MTSAVLQGNDFSHWQGFVDWPTVSRATGFEILKATEGSTIIDQRYAAGIAALRLAHEPRGSYHYPNAGNPVVEAHYYVSRAGRIDGELQALDFEGAVLGLADPVGWAAAWLGTVIGLSDNVPVIYMSASTLTRFDWRRVIDLGVGLWCAHWGADKPDHGQWPFAILLQTSETGRLAGVDGAVDTDIFFGDAATWARYAANRHPAPPSGPTPAPKPVPLPKPPATHVVAAGETLSSIAAAWRLSVAELVALNRLAYPSLVANPNHIEPGWRLTTAGHPQPKPPAPAPAPVKVHVVAAGETLSSIATAARLGLHQLLALNPSLMANPNHIEPGWKVRVA